MRKVANDRPQQDGVTIGLLLEAVLAVLVVITLRRTRTGSQEAVPLKLRGIGWLETIALPRFSFIQIWSRNSKMIRIALIARSSSAMPERPSTMQASIARFVS